MPTSLGAAWGRKGVNCSRFGMGCDVDGVRRGTFHFPAVLGWHVSPDPAANTDRERPDFQPSMYKTSPEPVSIYFLSLSPPLVFSPFFPPLTSLSLSLWISFESGRFSGLPTVFLCISVRCVPRDCSIRFLVLTIYSPLCLGIFYCIDTRASYSVTCTTSSFVASIAIILSRPVVPHLAGHFYHQNTASDVTYQRVSGVSVHTAPVLRRGHALLMSGVFRGVGHWEGVCGERMPNQVRFSWCYRMVLSLFSTSGRRPLTLPLGVPLFSMAVPLYIAAVVLSKGRPCINARARCVSVDITSPLGLSRTSHHLWSRPSSQSSPSALKCLAVRTRPRDSLPDWSPGFLFPLLRFLFNRPSRLAMLAVFSPSCHIKQCY